METVQRLVRCPGCGQNTNWQDNQHRPFCSRRCQLRDLGNWANEDYAIAGDRVALEDNPSGED